MPASHIDRDYLQLRRAVWLGLFSGTGVGLGYLLAGVPGVELMSLNAAVAGAALGGAAGIAVGCVSAVVYSLASPFGPPVPLLLAAQAVGMGLAGLLGALVAPALQRLPSLAGAPLAAAVGVTAALTLDLVTNVAAALALRLPLMATLVAGAPVALLHAGTSGSGFALLLPLLVRRVRHLHGRGPRAVCLACLCGGFLVGAPTAVAGEPGSPLPAVGDTLATAESAVLPSREPAVADQDSLAVAAPDSLAPAVADSAAVLRRPDQPTRRFVRDWRRPLWQPFTGTVRDDLQRHSLWLPVTDGGLGSAVHYFGEPGTAAGPRWTRDGLPLGTGHRYLDDPEALVKAGRAVHPVSFGLAVDGGLTGTVDLVARDPTADRDLVDTRWYKGAHETYLRDVLFLTAAARWRLGFAFGEVLDNEGYDFRTPGETRYAELEDPFQLTFPGHAKLRSGRGLVQRDLGEAGMVSLALENVRKLKSAWPAYGLEHQDLWTNRATLDWRGPAAGRAARLAFWWVDSDADWNRRRSSYRKLEGSTTGIDAHWGEATSGGRLTAGWSRWTVRDSGADPAWAGADTGLVRAQGERARLRGSRSWPWGPGRVTVAAGVWWEQHGGWLLGGNAVLAEARARPRWTATIERGGRAPRSDELATAWRFVVPGGRQTVALPNRDLQREDEWRLAADVRPSLAGFDLALGVAVRRLRDGIAWRPAQPGATVGHWDNGLALDSATVRAGLAREGWLFGWLRLHADGAWRTWQAQGDVRTALPPPVNYQLTVLWEQHFFQEDGILQLGWFLHNRGALDDPWHLAEPLALPALTRLDMLVGFRLLGADLGLEFLNLVGGGGRLTAGALDHGLELRWRLHWSFHY